MSKIKRILVSQPRPDNEKSPYFTIAEKYGVDVVFRPFIKVEGVNAKEFRQQKVYIDEYTAIIFTARTAIDHFFRLCSELRVTIPDTMKYFCTSEQIANYLQKYIQYRKRKVNFSETGKLDGLQSHLTRNKTENFLLPISDVSNGEFPLLDKLGIKYQKAVMYRTVSNDFSPEEEFNYDMLVFFSPAGINSLLKNFPNFEQGDIKIGTLGATTAKAVTDAGLRLDVAAPTPQFPSITVAIENFLKEQVKAAKKK